MKKIFVILMVLITSFTFGIDRETAKRALEKEQAFAAKYQARLVANDETIKKMINDAKKKDYQRRLAELRQRKYVLQYTLNKTSIMEEKEKLLPQFTAVVDEHTKLLQEFEIFVNSLT
jgi:sensor histidine kinase regulating citrate/malate metabolism